MSVSLSVIIISFLYLYVVLFPRLLPDVSKVVMGMQQCVFCMLLRCVVLLPATIFTVKSLRWTLTFVHFIIIIIIIIKQLWLLLTINLLKPTGHVIHQQFNIQQLYALPTLYLCVLYLSENKQRLVPLTAQTDWFL